MPDAVTESARNYVAKLPAAVSGSGGHNATFHAACILVNGFGLSLNEARPILDEFNARCKPPWTERELEHKLKSAEATNDPKGKGYLRNSKSNYVYRENRTPAALPSPSPVYARPNAQAQSNAKPGKYRLDAKAELPKPIDDGTRALLRAAFHEGEGVRIVKATLNAEEREIPEGQGSTFTREEWLKKLDERAGDINKILSSSKKTGIYVAINPLQPGGTRDDEVTAFRHALLEFDELEIDKQWQLIKQSEIPCSAVIHSGGRSLHAWVKVDARDREDYDAKVRLLYDHFAEYGVDFKNKNPGRLSRLPACVRFDARQELLALDIGAESFDDWASVAGQGLPPLECLATGIAEFEAGNIPLPDELIAGLLHRGHKMAIGGGSKTHKTWCLLDLAVSIATGGDWFGFKTKQGRVLYLNFEIDRPFGFYRFNHVAKAKEIEFGLEAVTLWNLRGHVMPHAELIPKVILAAKNRGYSMIILDPLYKIMGHADENKASDVTNLLNGLESLAMHTGAAVVYANHFSKGNQAGKDSIDRISGSGAQARDPDTILIMTKHEEESAFAIEATLRNFPSLPPFVVKWKFPLMSRVDLDPKNLKQAFKPEPKYKHSQVVPLLGDKAMTYTEWRKAAKSALGMGSSTFDRMLPDLISLGYVAQVIDDELGAAYKLKKLPATTAPKSEP